MRRSLIRSGSFRDIERGLARDNRFSELADGYSSIVDWFLVIGVLVLIGLSIAILRKLDSSSPDTADAVRRINEAAAKLTATREKLDQATTDARQIEPEGGS